MRFVCCVCLIELRPPEGDDNKVSHGYCKDCLAVEMKKIDDMDFESKKENQNGR